jgi:hypothetical protein
MSSTSPLTFAQHLAFRHDTTRPIRPFDEDRASDALRNTPKRQRGDVVASILLGCTPECLGTTINSDRSLGADPSTRCRSASVTGLAPSPRRPGAEKSSDAMRNLRGCGLWRASTFAKRLQTYIELKSWRRTKVTAVFLTMPATGEMQVASISQQDVNAAAT